jgi:FAD/FMN-containing dehydrogenase
LIALTPEDYPSIEPIQRRIIVPEMRRRAMAVSERAKAKRDEMSLVDALRASLRGEVIDRSDSGYDDARRVWNGLVDRHPAAIARCADAADVVSAVRVGSEQHPIVSVRGGGHQVAGSAVCDDGLVVDVSAMREVRVDPDARTARVEAGATWAEVDRATQRFGLATPGGEVSDTGVAGLTLGGGLGYMMRTHGLSCDNLRSVEVVTADGELRTASRDEHPDLFWAVRGGGRGIGVVTSFEFELHPLGPEVATATVLYPREEAEDVLRAWREYALQAPEEITPAIGLWTIPPIPDIPGELHGSPVVIVAAAYIGPASEGTSAITPLQELGTPVADLSGVVPYVDAQSAMDELFPAGARYYWKSHFADELADEAIATLLEHDSRRPSPEALIYIRTLGGAIARVSDEESAFAHRSASFNVSIDATWSDPALDADAIEWARSTWDALAPFATGGVYLNFAGLGDDGDLRQATLGRSEQRLDEIRRAYDHEGVFETAAKRP